MNEYERYRAWLEIPETRTYIKDNYNGNLSQEAMHLITTWFPGMDNKTMLAITHHVINDIRMPDVAPPGMEFITYIVNGRPPQTLELKDTND